jgi:hypothetical protein
VCEAGDDALANRIANSQDDHGNRRGGVLGRQSRRRAPRQDHVYVQANQFRGQARESFIAAIGRSVLDEETASLNVPELPHPLSEPIDIGSI